MVSSTICVITKSDGTTVTNYYWAGDKVTHLTKGGTAMHLTYDQAGRPLVICYSGTNYYYKLNLQGDVIGIINTSGTEVVSYTYDAWGQQLTCTGSMASTLGADNPLRYRGYIYDTETGLYYLQARYYNPEWGRFISADTVLGAVGGINTQNGFAYCYNCSTSLIDNNGCIPAIYTAYTDQGNGTFRGSVPYGICGEGDRHRVFIIEESKLDQIKRITESDIIIIDYRYDSDPNMRIMSSYKVTSEVEQRQIAKLMLKYNNEKPVKPPWKRSENSLVEEWKCHNWAYKRDYAISRTADCDFNNKDEGMGFFDFIKRAIFN